MFISLMQSVNGAKIFIISSLLALFAATATAAVFVTVIVPLTGMYATL